MCEEGAEEVAADSRTHRVAVKGRKAAEDPMKWWRESRRRTEGKWNCSAPCRHRRSRRRRNRRSEVRRSTKQRRRRSKKGGIFLVETGVQTAEATVKGVFDSASLVAYVHKRQAAVVKQETEEKTKAAEKEKKAEGEKDVKTENGLPFDQ